LYLTITAGKVVEVSDAKRLLADIKPPTKNPSPETVEMGPDVPGGAIAKCGDGQFVFRNDDTSCFGKSGVAQKYSAPTSADALAKCGKQISSSEWNRMSTGQQAAFCGSAGVPSQPVNCGRPSTIGTLDWNRMSADQQRAACVPVTPVTPDKSEQPCPRPPTIGSLDWNRMSDAAKLAACHGAKKPD
jgi:hypothetical protein